MAALTPQDEADLAAAEVAPNTDDYDPAELRRAIQQIIDRRALDLRARIKALAETMDNACDPYAPDVNALIEED